MSETPSRAQRHRHDLVEQHLDLPRRMAQTLLPRCRQYIDLDELVALGNVGLSEAASRFDATRGVPFRDFAARRVRGAMLDGLRRQSPLPREVWRRIVALRSAADHLEHGAPRATASVTAQIGSTDVAATLAELRAALASVRTIYLTSLSELAVEQESADARRVDDELDHRRRLRDVAAAVASLPRRERSLVFKCYWEHKDLATASAELGLSKSWGCRLHARAVEQLRQWYGHDHEPTASAPLPIQARFAA
jgi:RNA polymerase sigma factor for flagellar operon FliA